MLKEAVASKAAKLLMTCVCPVAGTTALSLGVPQVRDAVHKATQPRQYAKPKTRVRPQDLEEGTQVAAAEAPCPSVTPFALSNLPTTGDVPSTPIQVAEAPQPDPTDPIPLSPRIFVPPASSPPPGSNTPVPEPETWVQLMLGFGLIGGVARITYRRNGTDPKAVADLG